MQQSNIVLYTDQSQFDKSAASFRHRQPLPKKYLLHKMKEKSKHQQERTTIDKKNPTYFNDMLKEQKKKLHVNTFIKKLRNSISLRSTSQNNIEFLQKCQVQKSYTRNIPMPKFVYQIILGFFTISSILLLVLNSISIMFSEVQKQVTFFGLIIFSLLAHIGQILRKSFFYFQYEQNKKCSATNVLKQYFYSYQFIQDIVIGICIIFYIANLQNKPIKLLAQLIICLKIKSVLEFQAYMELTFIQNQYRQQMWSLVKVFIFNFVFAHFLAIFLVLMTNLNPSQNWIIKKQIQPNNFTQIYIWAYYWATTIMLTVGFGDLAPTNKDQAICMIFIQTFSCIVLAYNINRLGNIIQKIRSYDLQQINSMKTFNQMNDKSEFSKENKQKITNYIKQSTIIKRDFNLQQEKGFLSKLPVNFKNDLCKQMYRPIWNGMTFFQNLSQNMLLELSISIQKKLAHPQEIVYSKGNPIQVMVFSQGVFGFTYQNGKSKRNGEIIHEFEVGKKQFKISTLDFLTQNELPYDIKCLDYSLLYSINHQNLLKIFKQSEYDCEYLFMTKDKDRYLMNQFQLVKCQFCPKQRHTLFKCPKCHYIPLKKHIIDKFRLNKTKKMNHLYQIYGRNDKILFKALKGLKIVNLQALKKRIQLQNEQRSDKYTFQESSEKIQTKKSLKRLQYFQDDNDSMNASCNGKQVQNSYIIQKALSKVQFNLKNQLMEKSFWQIQSDKVNNFKYYFKKFNVQSLNIKPKPKNLQKTLKSNFTLKNCLSH